jgi:hypothetical protein
MTAAINWKEGDLVRLNTTVSIKMAGDFCYCHVMKVTPINISQVVLHSSHCKVTLPRQAVYSMLGSESRCLKREIELE